MPAGKFDCHQMCAARLAVLHVTAIVVACFVGSLSLVSPATSQRSPFSTSGWSDQFALSGVFGAVRDIAVHGENVYVVGDFLSAGNAVSQGIACWNRATGQWTSLGGGVDGLVYALAVTDDGTVYAGGDFSTAGSTQASNIARWDGDRWSPLGNGTDELVEALAVYGQDL